MWLVRVALIVQENVLPVGQQCSDLLIAVYLFFLDLQELFELVHAEVLDCLLLDCCSFELESVGLEEFGEGEILAFEFSLFCPAPVVTLLLEPGLLLLAESLDCLCICEVVPSVSCLISYYYTCHQSPIITRHPTNIYAAEGMSLYDCKGRLIIKQITVVALALERVV